MCQVPGSWKLFLVVEEKIKGWNLVLLKKNPLNKVLFICPLQASNRRGREEYSESDTIFQPKITG